MIDSPSNPPSNELPGKLDAASSRFQRAAETFEAVRSLSAEERERALLERCGEDAELLVEVRSLLAFHDKPSETLDTAVIRTGVGAVIGRYRVAGILGEGGMGTVYLAVQEEPVRREVALKVIKLGMDTRQVVRRFEAERQAIAQMEHPHVARVLDAGSTSDGRPYFVMELVRGQPITQFCDQRQLEVSDRLRLFLDVCAAVQHAHQKGVIHRDLKPSNILVAEIDGRPVAKVIDFGIAKALSRPNTDRSFTTTMGDAVGTPDYMSPEQAGSNDVDMRSDVYALGVILYELLVGMTPLRARLRARSKPTGQGTSGPPPVPPLDELRRIVRDEDPLRALHALSVGDMTAIAASRFTEPRALTRALRGDLEAIAMKALALSPARRYATVAAFAEDLERHLRDETVSARVPSAAYYLAKLARRHTATLAAACLVVVAILTGLILALVGFEQARRDRDKAQNAQHRERLLADEVRAELFQRDIDRGRQRSREGNLNEARDLLWSAMNAKPDSLQARWALRELMWTRGPFVFFTFDHLVRSIAALHDEGKAIVGFLGSPPALIDSANGSIRYASGSTVETFEIAASPDGKHFACADADGSITLWDLATLREVRTIWAGAPGRSPILFDSPDTLVASMPDGDVRRFDIHGVQPPELLGSAGLPASRIARSRRGDIAVGLSGGRLLVLAPPDEHGFRVPRFLQPHNRTLSGLAFDPSGERLATASAGRDYKVFDADSFEELFGGQIFPGSTQDIGFVHGGDDLLISSWWDTIAVSMLDTEKRTFSPLIGSRLSISPSGKSAAYGSTNRWTCSILSLEDHALVRVVQPERDLIPVGFNLADGSALARNGEELAAIALDGPDRGRVRWSIPNERCRYAVVSPRGDRIATLNADGIVRVLSIPDGRELATSRNAISGEWGTLRFDGSGDRVAFVTRNSGVRIIDLALHTECIAVLPIGSEILGVSFDPRSDRLLVSDRGGATRVLGLSNTESILSMEMRTVFASTFLADGETVALGLWPGDFAFWDPATGEERVIRGHSAFPSRVDAHPSDPKLMISCADDGSVRIWHADLTQDLVAMMPYGPRQPIRHVQWTRDGKGFYVVGPDRAIRIYDIGEADRLIDANEPAERSRLATQRITEER